jgi:hypothetical protein
MTQRTLRRALGAAAVLAALPALAPAVASASTWTVDDDKAQCPSARFSSIQEAVDQAAPWDVIVVCDGLYEEQSTPPSGNGVPSAARSVNGLTITKPLTIRGTGASKVTIRPKSTLTTLAGDVPYLRDAGGNVVTVTRQSRDATDENTMFVDISGVTISSPNTTAEAGVAFFNANGAIRKSVVGPLRRAADGTALAAAPHGWGVIATNSQFGAEAGPRRRVVVEDSLVTGYQSGGIRFDMSTGADGAAGNLTRSGIVLYGEVTGTTVQGSGPSALIPQTGVEYHAGTRGAVTGSTVTSNYFTPAPERSVGVLLTDAETGVDPRDPSRRAVEVTGSALTGNGWGLVNADAGNTAVRLGAPVSAPGNWWGCATGPLVGAPSAGSEPASDCQGVSGDDATPAPSVELGVPLTAAPALAPTPGTVDDAPPTASFADPAGGEIVAGQPFVPTVAASDDFGVRAVAVEVDGELYGTAKTRPYEVGGWTPGLDEIGRTHTFTATVVDSSGQVTVATTEATVVAPDGWAALTVAPGALDLGTVFTGQTATKAVAVTNSSGHPLTLTAVDVAGAGLSVAGGCAPGTVLPVGGSCAAEVAFRPAAGGTVSGALTVASDAPGGTAVVVPLSATAVGVPVVGDGPAVSGRAKSGATLTCSPGAWSGSPSGYDYLWLRNGTPIAGATKTGYRVTVADVGARLACRVTAVNGAGAGAAAASAAKLVSFAAKTTKTTIARQAGAAVVTFTKVVRASRRGTVAPVKVACGAAGDCKVAVTGTLKVGKAGWKVAAGGTTAAGRTSTVSLKLSASARRALRAGGGRLTLKVTSRGARTGAATAKVTVKRG